MTESVSVRGAGGLFDRGPRPEGWSQLISEGRRRNVLEVEKVVPYPRSGRKPCSKCKKWKSWDADDRELSDFPVARSKLKSGLVRFYPKGECRSCAADRCAAYRDRLRAEGTYGEACRRWGENRPKRKPKKRPPEETVYVNAEPLMRWLEPLIEEYDEWVGRPDALRNMIGDLANHPPLTPYQRDHLRQIEQRGRVRIRTADTLLLALDQPHVLAVLYGDS